MKKIIDLILSGSYVTICIVDQPYIIYLTIAFLYLVKALASTIARALDAGKR